MNTLRVFSRLTRVPQSFLLSRLYSSSSSSSSPPSSSSNNGNNNSEARKAAKIGTIHDDQFISGSLTNTRNYGKIKVDNDVTQILDSVLLQNPKFDDEDQTGMDYQDRMDAKREKINQMYPEGSEEREKALVSAHNQLQEEIKTELIREFQFDPIEHKRTQKYDNLSYVSTTEYTIPGMHSGNTTDSAPREETSGGFVFGSLNFASSATTAEDNEVEREYVKGHHDDEGDEMNENKKFN